MGKKKVKNNEDKTSKGDKINESDGNFNKRRDKSRQRFRSASVLSRETQSPMPTDGKQRKRTSEVEESAEKLQPSVTMKQSSRKIILRP